jgi:hypothetical protein
MRRAEGGRAPQKGNGMTDYIARVELHDEKEGDYPKLHAEMEKRGFARTIAAGSTTYHMPNATYLLIGDQTPQQVYTLGAAAANAIGGKARIIVAGSSFSQMWLGGLDPV